MELARTHQEPAAIDTLDLCHREIVPGWPRRRIVAAINQLTAAGWLKQYLPKGGGYRDDFKQWSIVDHEARSTVSLVGMTMTQDKITERRRDRTAAELSAMRNGRPAPPKQKSEHAKSAEAFLKWRRQQLELLPVQPEPPPKVVKTDIAVVRRLLPRHKPADRSREMQRELAFA